MKCEVDVSRCNDEEALFILMLSVDGAGPLIVRNPRNYRVETVWDAGIRWMAQRPRNILCRPFVLLRMTSVSVYFASVSRHEVAFTVTAMS